MFDSTVTKSGRKTVVVTAGRALRTVLWVRTVLLAALVALGLFALAPAAFGWIPTVVTTGSMTPAIRPGDVVVAAPLRASGAATVRPGSVVLAEDPAKPQSDQEVAQALQKRGLTIARRTVAKYREELGILPSHQRRLAPRKR